MESKIATREAMMIRSAFESNRTTGWKSIGAGPAGAFMRTVSTPPSSVNVTGASGCESIGMNCGFSASTSQPSRSITITPSAPGNSGAFGEGWNFCEGSRRR